MVLQEGPSADDAIGCGDHLNGGFFVDHHVALKGDIGQQVRPTVAVDGHLEEVLQVLKRGLPFQFHAGGIQLDVGIHAFDVHFIGGVA